MSSFLSRFPNLLLDEHISYDFHEIERKRIQREARLLRVKELRDVNDGTLFPLDINHRIDRMSIARKVFLHDILPAGAVGVYDSDEVSYVISNRKMDVECVTSERLFVPTIQFAKSKVRSVQKSVDWFVRREHDALFALLEKTDQVITQVGDITTAAINSAFREIERHDEVVNTILCGDWALAVIDSFGSEFYDRPSFTEQLYLPNFRGHLYTANIYHSAHPALVNKTYFLPALDKTGVFTDRGYLSSGNYHSEEWGMALVNPYLVSCIVTV